MTIPHDLLSETPSQSAIHAVTWFRSAFNPLPSHSDANKTAHWIIEALAPADGPRLKPDKGRVAYVVPTLLRVAPYVGKTAEKHPGRAGQQRSTSHVIAGSWFALDLDQLDDQAWQAIQQRLLDSDVLFCAYSSWSYGLKPGIRVRILLFMDQALAPLEWKQAWVVLNQHLFNSQLDKQTGHLAQQAGVWATHPDRAAQAFRLINGSKLLSADRLLAVSTPPRRQQSRPPVRYRVNPFAAGLYTPTTPERIQDALAWLNANDYQIWLEVGLGLKAAVMLGNLNENTALTLWLAFSDQAGDQAKSQNADSRYSPETLWDRLQPDVAPPEALLGKLFAMAREVALSHIRNAVDQGITDPISEQAAAYLGRYHRKAFDELASALEPAA